MKKLFFLICTLFSLTAFAQIESAPPPPSPGDIDDDTLVYAKWPYTYGIKLPRIYPTKVLRTPKDTIYTKAGLAIMDTVLWYGDEIKWRRSGDATSGAAGTVTEFSSGDLSPLFTTSVATSTTTPALSFSLSNTTAYTVFGRASGTGVPSFVSLDTNYIANFSTMVRPLLSAGTGVSYNNVTGVITNTGDLSATNELQTLSTSGTTTPTVTLSNSGGSFSITGAGIAVMSRSGDAFTVTATEVDGSITNELQTMEVTGTTTGILTLSDGGGSMTIAGGGINTIGVSGSTITITATEEYLGTVTSISMSGGTTGITTTGGPITSSGTFTLGGTLVVGHGGTGATSFTQYGVIYGNGTSPLQVTGVGLDGQLFIGTGAAPIWGNVVSRFTKFTAGLSSSDTNYLANLWVASGRGYDTSSHGSLQALSSEFVSARIFMNGSETVNPEDGYIGANSIMGRQYIREDTTGTHPLMAGQMFLAPVIVDGDGATMDAATVYIDGAPIGITPEAGGYLSSLWIRSGNLRMGQETVSTGSISWEGSTAGRFDLTVPDNFTSWAGKWPGDDGDADEVLVTDGSGNMDWVTLASLGSFVSSVTATGLLTSSGGTTPDISSSMTQGKLVGRGSASGTGIFQEITISTGLTLTGTTLTANDASPTNELQTITGTLGTATRYDVTLSAGGGVASFHAGSGIAFSNPSGDIIISAVDISAINELQTLSASGTSSPTITLSESGGAFSITGAGIAVASRSGFDITITATEVDGSITNELQTFSNTSDATSHTVTLSNSGGSVQLIEGTGITLTTGGTELNGTITITSTGGGVTDVTATGLLTSSGGTTPDISSSIAQARLAGRGGSSGTGIFEAISVGGILSFSGTTLNATEVDGDITNELQTIAVTGTTTGITTLSNSGGSMTIAGAGINTIGVSGSTITITGTEVDGSITNELQTLTNSSSAGQHTITLSNSGGTMQFLAGTGISFSSGGSASAGTVTISQAVITTSGTYTPTLTHSENVSSSTAYQCQYMRVGDVVTVSGKFKVGYTSAPGTFTRLGISLPVGSVTFGVDHHAGGVASEVGDFNNNSFPIRAVSATGRVEFAAYAPADMGEAQEVTYWFTFTYLIVAV